MRQFDTGALRNDDKDKLDYEGFLSPVALEAFAKYMHHHRKLEDGTLRASDNWQKGIPREQLMKSAMRHFMDWWKEHDGYKSQEGLESAICGVLFNAMAYLHDLKKDNEPRSV